MLEVKSRTFSVNFVICALLLPSTDTYTPSVSIASSGAFLCSVTDLDESSGSCKIRRPFISSFVRYFHCDPSHLKSIRYQLLLAGTNAPPVAFKPPAHISSERWKSGRRSSPLS